MAQTSYLFDYFAPRNCARSTSTAIYQFEYCAPSPFIEILVTDEPLGTSSAPVFARDNGYVSNSPTKRGLELFLGLTPLTAEQKRARRRLIRIVVYSDEALLVASILTLSKKWADVGGAWLVTNLLLLFWYFLAIQSAKRKGQLNFTATQRSEASGELYVRTRRYLPLGIASGVAFIMVGFFNTFGFVCAAFMIVSSVGLFVWARRRR